MLIKLLLDFCANHFIFGHNPVHMVVVVLCKIIFIDTLISLADNFLFSNELSYELII